LTTMSPISSSALSSGTPINLLNVLILILL
jgi:hypothetical protein